MEPITPFIPPTRFSCSKKMRFKLQNDETTMV